MAVVLTAVVLLAGLLLACLLLAWLLEGGGALALLLPLPGSCAVGPVA